MGLESAGSSVTVMCWAHDCFPRRFCWAPELVAGVVFGISVRSFAQLRKASSGCGMALGLWLARELLCVAFESGCFQGEVAVGEVGG
jgi:hypothetical protein